MKTWVTAMFLFAALGGCQKHGRVAPEFDLKSSNGEAVSLQGLRGKPVLIDFWATWCEPCRVTLPMVEKLHNKYKDKGLKVIGISSDSAEEIKEFRSRNSVTYPMLVDKMSMVQILYEVETIPHLFVLNSQGEIVADFKGIPKSEQEVEDAVKGVLP